MRICLAQKANASPGLTVRGSREAGHCDDDEWLAHFNGCLDCALEFEIWEHYGDSIGEAADVCGLDAIPKAAETEGEDDDAAGSAPAAPPPSSAVVEATSTATSAASHPEHATSKPGRPTPVPTGTRHSNTVSIALTFPNAPHLTIEIQTATPTPTYVPDSGASQFWASHILVGAAALVVAANLV